MNIQGVGLGGLDVYFLLLKRVQQQTDNLLKGLVEAQCF